MDGASHVYVLSSENTRVQVKMCDIILPECDVGVDKRVPISCEHQKHDLEKESVYRVREKGSC